MQAILQVLQSDHEDSAERREGSERAAIARATTLRDDAGTPHQVTVDDMAPGGFRFSAPLHLDPGTSVRLGLSGAGVASGRVVWRSGTEHGCVFDRVLTPDELQAAFTATGTVAGNFPRTAAVPPYAEPIVSPWPRPVRLGVALGAGALAWAGALAITAKLLF